MTKDQFKERWESDGDGGGITFDDLADCAKEWGISSIPRIMRMDSIRYRVLRAAGTNDAEDYTPEQS